MKIIHKFSLIVFCFIIMVCVMSSTVHATSTPTLSISASNTGSGNLAQISVSGADPDAAVILYYPSNANSQSSIGLGLTNQYGVFSSSLNPSSYGITSGSSVYVSVDGAQSATVSWPSISGSSGSLLLSQTNLNLAGGQSSTITATGISGTLSITANSNAGIAVGQVFGNSIVVTAYNNPGTTVLTLCDSSNDCQNLNVSVVTGSNTNFTISSTVANLSIGQSQTVTLSGLGPFYISQNSNPDSISATINGNNLILNGLYAGGANINVCQSNNQCDTINAYVNSSASSISSSGNIVFNPENLNVVVGQNQIANMSGGNSNQYYVSSNSNQSIVLVTITGNILTVTGVNPGSTNISVCNANNQCAMLPVIVSSSNASSPLLSSTPPGLSSITISTNSQNGLFLSTGNAITITFNFNQTVNNPMLDFNGIQVPVVGSGSGPYSASYVISANTTLLLPVSITFTNPAGSGGQTYFWISNSSSITPSTIPTTTSTISCPVGLTCKPNANSGNTVSTASSGSYSFNRYLYMGMTKLGVTDPDVKALQQRLKVDGVYSGPVTGYFGSQTKAGLEAYQKKNGLSPIGVVGPGTRAALNKGI